MPAAAPIIKAGIGFTKPEAGVIATNPATAPKSLPTSSACPPPSIPQTATTRPPPLLQSASPQTRSRPSPMRQRAASIESKPAHPQQSPRQSCSARCYADACVRCRSLCASPDTSRRPAPIPPDVICTTVPPAKSKAGNLPVTAPSKPPTPHTMCAIGKYTITSHSAMNSIMPVNLMRSAKAPEDQSRV